MGQHGCIVRGILIIRVTKLRVVLSFLATVLITAVHASIIGTQLILAEIAGFGLDVSMSDRILFTLHDIAGLAPGLSILLGITFLIAFLIASMGHWKLGGNRFYWLMAAGFTSLPLALLLIRWVMGVSVFAAARTGTGIALMALVSLAGGWVFAILTQKRTNR